MRLGKRERLALRLKHMVDADIRKRIEAVPETAGHMRSAWDRKSPITQTKARCLAPKPSKKLAYTGIIYMP